MSLITIDKNSGFCFGVVRAIAEAEKQLSRPGNTAENEQEKLYCLGEIVHNTEEVERLEALGLRIIDTGQFDLLRNAKVLIRAHGEPPATYQKAKENHIRLVDATCPIVLKLQERIRQGYEQMQAIGGQVLIFGKAGHAEVIGLNGQTGNHALVISSLEDLEEIDFSKPTLLYAQTTMNREQYQEIIACASRQCALHHVPFTAIDSICKSMSARASQLAEFSKQHDAVVFVSGKQSSNGKYLYGICQTHNPAAFFISRPAELRKADFATPQGQARFKSIGICGATSTPMWLMEAVAARIKQFTACN